MEDEQKNCCGEEKNGTHTLGCLIGVFGNVGKNAHCTLYTVYEGLTTLSISLIPREQTEPMKSQAFARKKGLGWIFTLQRKHPTCGNGGDSAGPSQPT